MSLRDEFDEYIGYIDNDINNFRDNASQNLDLFENKFHYISAGAIYLIISVFLGGDKCFHVPIPHLAVLFFGISLLISLYSYLYMGKQSNAQVAKMINAKHHYNEAKKSIIDIPNNTLKSEEFFSDVESFERARLLSDEVFSQNKKNERQINLLNHATMVSFFFGLLTLFIFLISHSYVESKQRNSSTINGVCRYNN